MFFSPAEIIDLLIMIAATGFIFKDSMKGPEPVDYDPLLHARQRFDFSGFRTAVMITAPAIALHEISHKLVAVSAGVPAEFHASYLWLVIGVALKLANFPFIFFVPGYVAHAAAAPLTGALIAFAGPAINLALWLGAAALLKSGGKFSSRAQHILAATSQINMFLFLFNMIPLPPFDGYTVFRGLAALAGINF